MQISSSGRRSPHPAQGAFVRPEDGSVSFCVWAPQHQRVEVVLEPDGRRFALKETGGGFFQVSVPAIAPGQLYRYSLDGGTPLADPASRYQPSGVNGPSEVIDPQSFVWTDRDWPGISINGQVLYEFHVGTFTPEGTFRSAQQLLPELKRTGITVLEMMPVADFGGRFGWGYDGVFFYSPYEQYGRPEDLAAFIDAAHRLGMGVILDVVYNHLGPTGNVLPSFAKPYLSETETTDWGAAFNYDGPQNRPVRDFVCDNTAHWIEDYHFDGLRIDATQDMHDRSDQHIVAELVERGRAAAGKRGVIFIAENEPQQSYYVRSPKQGGYGLDALWNDDFHHSATVSLTGQSDAYYSDYKGRPQEFISALKYGYLYQGQWYVWQKKQRGVPGLDLPKPAFVNFIENHDQVANSARGARAHDLSNSGRLRALTTVLLLGPSTPMLFQGQEYAANHPFLFFADHCGGDLARNVRQGRRDFLRQWQSMSDPKLDAVLPDPCNPETFQRCKLDPAERLERQPWLDLHIDLLRLRREDPVFSQQGRAGLDGAVLGTDSFVMRFFSESGRDDRILLVNLGVEFELTPVPEPLLAAPPDSDWSVLWSSEDPCYGGNGVAPVINEGRWRLAGNAATVLAPASGDNKNLYRGEQHN